MTAREWTEQTEAEIARARQARLERERKAREDALQRAINPVGMSLYLLASALVGVARLPFALWRLRQDLAGATTTTNEGTRGNK